MINLQFRDQVDFIIDKIASGDNFSLSRYGDGELAIIEGREIGKDTQAYEIDGWHTDGNAGVFAKDLRNSLNRTEEISSTESHAFAATEKKTRTSI